jgi:hypothetical protein
MFRKAMIKTKNDRKAEDVTWPVFISAAMEGVHCQQNRKIICQYEGVDGRKIYKKRVFLEEKSFHYAN